MTSTNGSGRPTGSISIPVEIIRDTDSTTLRNPSRHNSPYGSFSDSPRFQPRQSPSTAYDRLINNSQFNQQRINNERNPSYFSRSNDDLLSNPYDSIRVNTQPQYTTYFTSPYETGLRPESDFIHVNKYPNSLRRSFETLNDFPEPFANPHFRSTYTNPTLINPNIVYTNEFGVPVDSHPVNERARSPKPPSDEPELKMAKDSNGPIPMPAPASLSSQATDQQVPSPARDPNSLAIEKLEQIKHQLDDLEKQVDQFAGTSREDRAYKFLDEQALKIMIHCDELVDVSADIKEKRREMIRNVQRVIGKLELKVPVQTSNAIEIFVNENDRTQIQTTTSPPKEQVDSDSTIST